MAEKRRIPESEAELVEIFLAKLAKINNLAERAWTAYPEACGWDLVLVESGTGIQIGIEAKLSLNAKVLAQALKGGHEHWSGKGGPDYRAVLVPSGGRGEAVGAICDAIGISIISIYDARSYGPEPQWELSGPGYSTLPDEVAPDNWTMKGWHCWLPDQRLKLPDYIPDVRAGISSPVQLTEWKVRAIKLWIIIDRRGIATRADMKLLGLHASRFTDRHHGFLAPDPMAGGYVRHPGSPDLRRQHPRNYEEIAADWAKWAPPGYLIEADEGVKLL